ncbi:MAG: DsrE family protein [Acidimicrobiales bacterium]
MQEVTAQPPPKGPSLREGARAVVHVDDADLQRQRLALGNVANLLADTDMAGARVEVVFNGPAISALAVGSVLAADLSALAARGVGLLACSNSMAAAGISNAGLVPGVTVVPSGISHLVRRQHDGWAYVRP